MREHSGVVRIAGICGSTRQAVSEAELAASLGYHAGLLSLAALRDATIDELIVHARAVAQVIPLFGFYVQPSVGGRILPLEFWHKFCQIEQVVAIKMAPFNRYQTLDVIRAVAESGRAGDITLYTGNDDHIAVDLLTRFQFGDVEIRFAGGLLGQWAVWTRRAVEMTAALRCLDQIRPEWLTLAEQLTDANAAIFEPAHQFRGCIPGIHEVLRHQDCFKAPGVSTYGGSSPGHREEIDSVIRASPQLTDDDFVREHLDQWLR
jgi:hypothetical protein